MGLTKKQIDMLIPGMGEAANEPYRRRQQFDIQRAEADARLAQLIKGQELEQEALDQNFIKANEDAQKAGLKPGKYSVRAGVNFREFNPENDSFASQLGRELRGANITGFDITDPQSVIPSRKDAEEVKQVSQVVKQAQGELPGVRQSLQGSGKLDRFGAMSLGPLTIGTEKGRDLEQRKAALLSYAQRLANTGVMQPGELPTLTKRVGEVTGIASMFRDPEDIARQLDALEADLINKAKSTAISRGYTPKKGYLDSSPQTGAASNLNSLSDQELLDMASKLGIK